MAFWMVLDVRVSTGRLVAIPGEAGAWPWEISLGPGKRPPGCRSGTLEETTEIDLTLQVKGLILAQNERWRRG